MGGISIWQLLIVALILVVVVGTKKVRSLGGELGGAVKGLKNAMSSEEDKKALEDTEAAKTAQTTQQTTEKKPESNKEQV